MPVHRFRCAVSPAWVVLPALWLGCAPPATNGAPPGPAAPPPIVFDGDLGLTDGDEDGEASGGAIPGLLDPGGATAPGDDPAEPDPALVEIAPDSAALLVTDPAALQGLTLRDVLYNLDWNGDNHVGLLQRMFDTFNTSDSAVHEGAIHCDAENNAAFANAPPASCPRPEGSLAASTGFFTPGHPDHFTPVAAVNRFDLRSNGNCGEHRLIFAKDSGKVDPNNRVFLIFEALATPDPGAGLECVSVAEHWRDIGLAQDPAKQGELLAKFYLYGLPGIPPVLSRKNLGEQGAQGGYAPHMGRIRVSVHAGGEWELRELRADTQVDGSLAFVPSLVGNTPASHLFGPVDPSVPDPGFISHFVNTQSLMLSAGKVEGISTFVQVQHLAGDSPAGGPMVGDFAAIAAKNPLFLASLQNRIDALGLSVDCPPGDPLTPESILRRATSQTCAGCHAPKVLLGPERKLGCGLVWPETLDGVHIDEHGNRSPALQQVFLPQRAADLSDYLSALPAGSGAP